MKKSPAKKVAKVPVIMQMEALECGAASLAMILAYYDKWIPLQQVREDCGVSRDGSNAQNIILAARSYGLSAKGYRYEQVSDLKEAGSFPCIVFWDFNHFVVLDGFRGGKAILNDPARGKVAVSMEEFGEAFTGVCLNFEPADSFEPSGKPASIWRFVKERLKGSLPVFVLSILMTLITTAISMVNPAFSSIFLDKILGGGQTDWLTPFLLVLLIFNVLQLVIGFTRSVYLLKVQGKFAITSNSKFMWHILCMPMNFFTQRTAGDIASRRSANETISNNLIQTFAPLFLDLVTLIIYVTIIFRYSPLLSCIGIASLVINMLVSNIVSKKRINFSRVAAREHAKLSSTTMAAIDMIETIKASGAENGFFEKWAGLQATANANAIAEGKMNLIWGNVPVFISSVCNVSILLIGVWLVVLGQWSTGMILAFQGYLSSFMSPVMNLITARQSVQELRTDMERIEDVMQYPTDVEFDAEPISEEITWDKLKGNIEMKHVTFGYAKLAPPLINDFNLTIHPGDKIAFVGLSGCGKSTLAKLLSGLYEPWSGEITYDGKKRSEIPREVFTSSIAVVDQEVILFEDTVGNNIRMWDQSIENFGVILAARDADIHDTIVERKDGYNHRVLKGGGDFSGGQRQRMEIARVLAQDPTVVIMDEATSALDTKTEQKIINSIQKRGITSIVIAHRLSTVRDANLILVMDNGLIVEQGTHEELYAKGGLYTKLVSSE